MHAENGTWKEHGSHNPWLLLLLQGEFQGAYKGLKII